MLYSSARAQTLSPDEIISRMQQAQTAARQRAIPYTVTRRYTLAGQNIQKPTSEVVAEVNFIPPSHDDYTLRSVEGSDHGGNIVREVLEHESQMTSHVELYEVSPRNYDFVLLGRAMLDDHNCYVLQLKPRRQAAELLRGQAWIDANSFLVRRIEGEPAKSPSWWLKNLHVMVNYDDVDGIWLQHDTRAVADVRFAGTRVLTAREVDVRTAAESAQNRSPGRTPVRRRNSHRALADSAAWVAR
jgi:hypothetical protein